MYDSLVVLHLQRSVPVWTFIVRVPSNPLTARLHALSSPTKSSFMYKMQLVQRLSTPMTSESVSNRTVCSVAFFVAFVCIASMDIAAKVMRDRCLCLLMVSATVNLFLGSPAFRSIQVHILLHIAIVQVQSRLVVLHQMPLLSMRFPSFCS